MIFIKKLRILVIFIFVLLPLVATADFSFTPRLAEGIMNYNYKENYVRYNDLDVEWKDTMPFIGIGATLSNNGLSLDVYAQKTDTGKDSSFDTGHFSDDQSYIIDDNATFDRTDYSITLGYRLNKLLDHDFYRFLSVFAGYKAGKTDIGATSRIISSDFPSSHDTQETQFKTKGPFLGVSYNYPVGESSSLGIKMAYASLNTDYDSNVRNIEAANTGLIWINLNWSSPITKNLTYHFSLDAQQYTMGSSSTNLGLTIDSIEEKIISFKALLSYSFDLF